MMTAEPGASISQFAPQDIVDLFWRRRDLEALLKAFQGAAGAKVVRCCSTGKDCTTKDAACMVCNFVVRAVVAADRSMVGDVVGSEPQACPTLVFADHAFNCETLSVLKFNQLQRTTCSIPMASVSDKPPTAGEVEAFLRRVRAGSVPVLYTDIKEAAQRSEVCTALVQSEETRMELAEEDDALEMLGSGLLEDDADQSAPAKRCEDLRLQARKRTQAVAAAVEQYVESRKLAGQHLPDHTAAVVQELRLQAALPSRQARGGAAATSSASPQDAQQVAPSGAGNATATRQQHQSPFSGREQQHRQVPPPPPPPREQQQQASGPPATAPLQPAQPPPSASNAASTAAAAASNPSQPTGKRKPLWKAQQSREQAANEPAAPSASAASPQAKRMRVEKHAANLPPPPPPPTAAAVVEVAGAGQKTNSSSMDTSSAGAGWQQKRARTDASDAGICSHRKAGALSEEPAAQPAAVPVLPAKASAPAAAADAAQDGPVGDRFTAAVRTAAAPLAGGHGGSGLHSPEGAVGGDDTAKPPYIMTIRASGTDIDLDARTWYDVEDGARRAILSNLPEARRGAFVDEIKRLIRQHGRSDVRAAQPAGQQASRPMQSDIIGASRPGGMPRPPFQHQQHYQQQRWEGQDPQAQVHGSSANAPRRSDDSAPPSYSAAPSGVAPSFGSWMPASSDGDGTHSRPRYGRDAPAQHQWQQAAMPARQPSGSQQQMPVDPTANSYQRPPLWQQQQQPMYPDQRQQAQAASAAHSSQPSTQQQLQPHLPSSRQANPSRLSHASYFQHQQPNGGMQAPVTAAVAHGNGYQQQTQAAPLSTMHTAQAQAPPAVALQSPFAAHPTHRIPPSAGTWMAGMPPSNSPRLPDSSPAGGSGRLVSPAHAMTSPGGTRTMVSPAGRAHASPAVQSPRPQMDATHGCRLCETSGPANKVWCGDVVWSPEGDGFHACGHCFMVPPQSLEQIYACQGKYRQLPQQLKLDQPMDAEVFIRRWEGSDGKFQANGEPDRYQDGWDKGCMMLCAVHEEGTTMMEQMMCNMRAESRQGPQMYRQGKLELPNGGKVSLYIPCNPDAYLLTQYISKAIGERTKWLERPGVCIMFGVWRYMPGSRPGSERTPRPQHATPSLQPASSGATDADRFAEGGDRQGYEGPPPAAMADRIAGPHVAVQPPPRWPRAEAGAAGPVSKPGSSPTASAVAMAAGTPVAATALSVPAAVAAPAPAPAAEPAAELKAGAGLPLDSAVGDASVPMLNPGEVAAPEEGTALPARLDWRTLQSKEAGAVHAGSAAVAAEGALVQPADAVPIASQAAAPLTWRADSLAEAISIPSVQDSEQQEPVEQQQALASPAIMTWRDHLAGKLSVYM